MQQKQNKHAKQSQAVEGDSIPTQISLLGLCNGVVENGMQWKDDRT
jgi:hypothetical protein